MVKHDQAAALPELTWEGLRELLLTMAEAPVHKAMIPHLVEGLRKQAHFLTLGGVLREISIITLAVTDGLGPKGDPPPS